MKLKLDWKARDQKKILQARRSIEKEKLTIDIAIFETQCLLRSKKTREVSSAIEKCEKRNC